MRLLIIIAVLVSVVGCDWVNPQAMRTKVAREQLQEQHNQTVALNRIADAIERK